MWGSQSLVNFEEIDILRYEKWMISLHIKDLAARLSMSKCYIILLTGLIFILFFQKKKFFFSFLESW